MFLQKENQKPVTPYTKSNCPHHLPGTPQVLPPGNEHNQIPSGQPLSQQPSLIFPHCQTSTVQSFFKLFINYTSIKNKGSCIYRITCWIRTVGNSNRIEGPLQTISFRYNLTQTPALNFDVPGYTCSYTQQPKFNYMVHDHDMMTMCKHQTDQVLAIYSERIKYVDNVVDLDSLLI